MTRTGSSRVPRRPAVWPRTAVYYSFVMSLLLLIIWQGLLMVMVMVMVVMVAVMKAINKCWSGWADRLSAAHDPKCAPAR